MDELAAFPARPTLVSALGQSALPCLQALSPARVSLAGSGGGAGAFALAGAGEGGFGDEVGQVAGGGR